MTSLKELLWKINNRESKLCIKKTYIYIYIYMGGGSLFLALSLNVSNFRNVRPLGGVID